MRSPLRSTLASIVAVAALGALAAAASPSRSGYLYVANTNSYVANTDAPVKGGIDQYQVVDGLPQGSPRTFTGATGPIAVTPAGDLVGVERVGQARWNLVDFANGSSPRRIAFSLPSFTYPTALVVDASDRVYVVVYSVSSQRTRLRASSPAKDCSAIMTAGWFVVDLQHPKAPRPCFAPVYPAAVALDAAGDLYAAVANSSGVAVFSDPATKPKLIRQIDNSTLVTAAIGLANGLLYAVTSNRAIEVYDAGANGPTFPLRTITNGDTSLTFNGDGFAIGWDEMFVTGYNSGEPAVAVFSLHAKGQAQPRSILATADNLSVAVSR
jgi:hypothetical protein